MDFDDILSVGIGILAGVIIIDILLQKRNKDELLYNVQDEEYIVTSRGRKLYILEVTKKKIESVSKNKA